MANKHVKAYSIPLTFGKMKIVPTMVSGQVE
jgi:hypothetical protein